MCVRLCTRLRFLNAFCACVGADVAAKHLFAIQRFSVRGDTRGTRTPIPSSGSTNTVIAHPPPPPTYPFQHPVLAHTPNHCSAYLIQWPDENRSTTHLLMCLCLCVCVRSDVQFAWSRVCVCAIRVRCDLGFPVNWV